MAMELKEYIKDGFDEPLKEYIQSEEHTFAKQRERRCLIYLKNLLNDSQKSTLFFLEYCNQ